MKASSTPSPVRALVVRTHQPLIPQARQLWVGNFPLLPEIVLVQQQYERHRTVIGFDALAQRSGDIEGGAARSVGHQHVSGGAAQIAHAERGNIVLAREVPQDETDAATRQVDGLLVDLDADRGEIGFGKDALDVALDQAGLAHREPAEHTDLFCSVGVVMAVTRGQRSPHRIRRLPTTSAGLAARNSDVEHIQVGGG